MLPDEEQAGYTFRYGSDRGEMAFIMHQGVPNLTIRQANSTAFGIVNCLKPEDCVGLEIKMVRAGIANVPDRFNTVTYTDEKGMFDFKGVPQMTLNVHVEKKHFCWERQMKQVEIDRMKLVMKVEFD